MYGPAGLRCEHVFRELYESAGYDNASKFSESFKKRYGATPSQYRAHAKEAAKQSIETKME